MHDDQIIQLYWQRDSDAIAQTANKYGAYCFTIADQILLNKQDSEECVNDTWLNTWNAIPPVKPSIFRLFLARITRNLALNRYNARQADKRGRGEVPLVLDELAECIANHSDVEQEYLAKELGICIRNFVKTLPEREAKIFLRRYFYAEAVSTIALYYRISENHTSVILKRTRAKLKAHLTKEGFFDESK